MRRYGYRPRAPLTVTQFAEAMAALGEVFAVHVMEGLDHEPVVIGDREWTLFGICVDALVQRFFEPDPAVAHRSRVDPPGTTPARTAGAGRCVGHEVN